MSKRDPTSYFIHFDQEVAMEPGMRVSKALASSEEKYIQTNFVSFETSC